MKRVVLVRPVGPRNVGMVLRAVANFGPAELAVVAPRRPSLLVHPEFEQMAHGVEDVRDRCEVFDDLAGALAACTDSVGFTARPRDNRQRADWRAESASAHAVADDPDRRLALVFGSDEGGLSKGEVALCRRLCYLPTSAEHTSINLAMTVGIVLSSLFTGRGTHKREAGIKAIQGDTREYLKQHLKSVFGGTVARSDAARRDIEASIERIFSLAEIEDRDARAWHQMMRALGSRKSPADFGLVASPRRARRDQAREKARDEPPEA